MSGPFSDLDRPPLSAAALTSGLVLPGALWSRVEVAAETASTNADVLAAAAAGAPEGLVVVAEHQSAGRGRAGRSWSAPPRSGLMFSVLLRPPVATRPHWGSLPLLTGVALVQALRRTAGVDAVLKWPNDVLVGERKLAGILAESSGDAVVVGIGLNVSLRADELPVAHATSLLLEAAVCTDRDPLLRAVLRAIDSWYARWAGQAGDPETCGLLAAYRPVCATLGRDVAVHLPGDRVARGAAVDVDSSGRLVVDGPDGRTAFAAGDVIHLR